MALAGWDDSYDFLVATKPELAPKTFCFPWAVHNNTFASMNVHGHELQTSGESGEEIAFTA